MIPTRFNNGYISRRPLVLSLSKLLLVGIAQLPLLRAAPTRFLPFVKPLEGDEDLPMSPAAPTLWIYLAVAVGLVLLGGAFAGLTIALMGQDEIYLEVIKTSGEGAERKHAAKVLKLLNRGKHWVLVTLLLGNVITNETLPIVLDRSLGGGWPAVLGSTVLIGMCCTVYLILRCSGSLQGTKTEQPFTEGFKAYTNIVIFGEIIPQSICVRYGLPIGAWMSSLVLVLMYVLSPVAWPTAKLLDRLLGEEHGTTYKKAGLKTLVTLHKSLGAAGEQLNSDEVTIISAVLDLKEKPIGSIMTPMNDVFTMSADTILDEKTMDIILSAGYSRIPIYAPDNEQNFVGMLLVKILITYDPEDCKRVRDFALATLPETRPETSCLDIVNFFQEGKSHMVLVSEHPSKDYGALGVVTLEDVIEELIGEEIIDESDVFVDVHKAIRRMAPAPRSRIPKGVIVTDPETNEGVGQENAIDVSEEQQVTSSAHPETKRQSLPAIPETGTPLHTANLMRRTSSIAGASERENSSKRAEALKRLGPSNLASRPRQTRYNTVKIKPGGGTLADGPIKSNQNDTGSSKHEFPSVAPQGGVGEGLLSSAGKDAKDGVHALQTGYGTMDPFDRTTPRTPRSPVKNGKSVPVKRGSDDEDGQSLEPGKRTRGSRSNSARSQSTIGSLRTRKSQGSPEPKRNVARSGSITQNIVDINGIRKVVLETTSSSEDSVERTNGTTEDQKENGKPELDGEQKSGKKKRRRKRRKGGKNGEDAPLLEGEEE